MPQTAQSWTATAGLARRSPSSRRYRRYPRSPPSSGATTQRGPGRSHRSAASQAVGVYDGQSAMDGARSGTDQSKTGTVRAALTRTTRMARRMAVRAGPIDASVAPELRTELLLGRGYVLGVVRRLAGDRHLRGQQVEVRAEIQPRALIHEPLHVKLGC